MLNDLAGNLRMAHMDDAQRGRDGDAQRGMEVRGESMFDGQLQPAIGGHPALRAERARNYNGIYTRAEEAQQLHAADVAAAAATAAEGSAAHAQLGGGKAGGSDKWYYNKGEELREAEGAAKKRQERWAKFERLQRDTEARAAFGGVGHVGDGIHVVHAEERGDMISAATLPLTLPVVFPEDLERRNADNQ
jgi:hypothetical protein